MIRLVVKYGNRVLEQPTEPVTDFDGDLARLVEEMFASMYASNGVGLAAPQIGVPRRLAVVDISSGEDPKGRVVLCNPQILSTAGKQTMEEGCLSLPGFRAPVARPQRVSLRAQNVHGEWFETTAEDLLARAFCHETDHLNGRLFLAHVSPLRRDMIKRKVRKLIKAGEW